MMCAHCGHDTADKIVMRDGWGQVRGTTSVPNPEFDNRYYALVDRGEDMTRNWECFDCRTAFRRQDALEREEYEDEVRYGWR